MILEFSFQALKAVRLPLLFKAPDRIPWSLQVLFSLEKHRVRSWEGAEPPKGLGNPEFPIIPWEYLGMRTGSGAGAA